MSSPARTVALALLLALAGCAGEKEETNEAPPRLYTFREPHMGTEFTFRIWAEESRVEDLEALVRRAFDRVAELNRCASDYLPESEINDFARAPVGEAVPVSDDLYFLLSRGAELSKQSGGAFDPTAGPLIRLWRISKKNGRLPTAEQIEKAKARTGSHLLAFDPDAKTITKQAEGMLFDLGGIAKGYAADEALALFREGGFPRALVAASGDIVVGDPPPGRAGWRIGIESLDLEVAVSDLPVVELANRAISTSGDTRRYFELDGVRYSHIVSTKTGLGLTERIAASVIAPDATTSDSHATAVTLLGRKEGLQFIENQREIECQIVALHHGREVATHSDGFSRFQAPQAEEEGSQPAP